MIFLIKEEGKGATRRKEDAAADA